MATDDPDFDELNPGFAERQARAERRVMEKKWARINKAITEIQCEWTDPPHGEPQKGSVAEASVVIGDNVLRYVVGEQVRADQDGRMTLDPNVKQYGYRGSVEKWALWKYHTIRGTPCTERDVIQTEPGYMPPKFIWAEHDIEEQPRRGRPPKSEAKAA